MHLYSKFLVILLVVVVFLLELFRNDCVYAVENTQKCYEFIEPSDLNDLNRLRMCIEEIKITKENEKANKIILNSYQGSYNLYEKIINLRKISKVNP